MDVGIAMLDALEMRQKDKLVVLEVVLHLVAQCSRLVMHSTIGATIVAVITVVRHVLGGKLVDWAIVTIFVLYALVHSLDVLVLLAMQMANGLAAEDAWQQGCLFVAVEVPQFAVEVLGPVLVREPNQDVPVQVAVMVNGSAQHHLQCLVREGNQAVMVLTVTGALGSVLRLVEEM